jgi:thymidylate synthase (FAD)
MSVEVKGEENMNFVTEPEVALVGKPVLEIDGIMRFLDEHGYSWPELTENFESMASLGDNDGEWLVEMAGRMCYQSWPKQGETTKGRSHEDHIKHLIEVGHGACIEHANFNFVIWNISRSLTHELVRHRIASYSQLSQRYVDSSNVKFIVPPAIQELEKIDPDAYRMWIEHCERSRQLYEELTAKLSDMYGDVESKLERRKKARQAARSVLPNATETKIFVTMNSRALRHLIELRANPAADVEIRKLAVKVCRILQDKAPLFAYGLDIVKLPDGTEGVESEYKRT